MMTSKLTRAGNPVTTGAPRRVERSGRHNQLRARASSQIRKPDVTSLPVTPGVGRRPLCSSETVAFVLQGGGSLAAAQVGMLRALTEHGIAPDLVVGSSAGALNAVAFADNPTSTGLDRLEALWLSIRRRHVAPAAVKDLLKAVTGRSDGLVSNAALRRLLETRLGVTALGQTLVSAHVVATDRHSGLPVILSDGDAIVALLASCAFPGLYPSVRIGARELIDGGVAAAVPVLQAEALGATVSYILPAAVDDDTQVHGPLPLAYRALGQILECATRRDIATARGQILRLPAPTSTAAHPVDFHDTARLITQGYQLTENWLAARAVVAGHAAG